MKFGVLCDLVGGFVGYDVWFVVIWNFVVYLLKWFGIDYFDIYCLVCVDLVVLIEEMVGVIVDFVKVGYVCYIGLLEVGVDMICCVVVVVLIVEL